MEAGKKELLGSRGEAEDICLTGEKIVLRSMQREDCPYIVKWRNHPRIRCRFFYREPFTMEGELTFFENKVMTGQVIQLMICARDTKEPVGTVFLQDIDKENRTADYGFLIGEDSAVGKGYGGETIDLVKKYAKEGLGLTCLTGKIIDGNRESEGSWTRHGAHIIKRVEGELCSDGERVTAIYTEMPL